MPRLVFSAPMPCSVEALWAFHSSADALTLLTPPSKRVEFLSDDTRVATGVIQKIRVRQFGIPLVWVAKIEVAEPPTRFVDVALRSPFKSWRHEHRFEPGPEGSVLTDTVDYEVPFGPFGRIADALFIRRDLEAMFAHRHRVTREAVAPQMAPA